MGCAIRAALLNITDDFHAHAMSDQRTPTAPAVEATSAAGPQQTSIPVIEESLTIDKVEHDLGGYRISKQVTQHDQLVDELLRDRRVTVERRPMGLPLAQTELPTARYEGDTLVLPVIEEVLVTEKRWMLVEEVRITTVDGTHRTTEHVRLRKEQVVVERLPVQASPTDTPPEPPGFDSPAPIAPQGPIRRQT